MEDRETKIDWSQYIKVDFPGHSIAIRDTVNTPWPDAVFFTLEEAADAGAFIVKLVEKARRETPEIQELTETLADIDSSAEGEFSWEDIAYALVQRGYHK
jgi:hypothetical protein